MGRRRAVAAPAATQEEAPSDAQEAQGSDVNPGVIIGAIAALATAGVVARPFGWPEAVWAVAGAALVVLLGLLPVTDALRAIGKGGDVYAFLGGMMLLSETARRAGVFDWVAAAAVRAAAGRPARLFALVYAAGVVVTTFLSNDATAVVLTPAVFAAAKRAEAEPLPLLFVCALVANAASFVLPIANPANLVLYGAAAAGARRLVRPLRSAVARRCRGDVRRPARGGGRAARDAVRRRRRAGAAVGQRPDRARGHRRHRRRADRGLGARHPARPADAGDGRGDGRRGAGARADRPVASPPRYFVERAAACRRTVRPRRGGRPDGGRRGAGGPAPRRRGVVGRRHRRARRHCYRVSAPT